MSNQDAAYMVDLDLVLGFSHSEQRQISDGKGGTLFQGRTTRYDRNGNAKSVGDWETVIHVRTPEHRPWWKFWVKE